MPKIFQHSQIAPGEAHINNLTMAFCGVGDRLDWPNANGKPNVQVCCSRSRLFHQVGGGQTPNYYLQQNSSRIYLGVHYMLI